MRFLTINEVAAQLGMGRAAVQGNIARGSLPAHRIGIQWVILPEDLEKFVQERTARHGRVKMHEGGPGRPGPRRPKRAA